MVSFDRETVMPLVLQRANGLEISMRPAVTFVCAAVVSVLVLCARWNSDLHLPHFGKYSIKEYTKEYQHRYLSSRIKLKIYTSNHEREILTPSLSIAHGEPKDVRRIKLVTEPAGAWT